MANLKALKSRIKSVKSTQKMTRAMKMVAASKLRRAKQLVEASRPYADKIGELMSYLASNISVKRIHDYRFPLLTGRGNNKVHLLVVLSSDRGLCGGLNTSVVKYAKNYINHLTATDKEFKILCVGKKAYDQLKGLYGDKIIDTVFGIFKNNINYEIAEEITKKITESFDHEEFDVCDIIYSKFKSAIAQEPVIKQLIPASTHLDNENYKAKRHRVVMNHLPIYYEPCKEELLEALLPKSLVMQVYNELLETSASEQGARMAAMESATNNAGKMIKNLTLVYNRTRQSNITKELIDIVSGANAV
jgi:F-type H+-transporting ATPase subunit gamma